MSDIFREVDEDVRHDRLADLWSKYSIIVLGLAIAIVAATAVFVYQRHLKQTKAEAAGLLYQAAQDLSQKNKSEASARAFEDLANSAPPGYGLLARLRAAEEKGLADPAAAVKEFDLIANDPSVDSLWRELAQLRAGALRVDDADQAEVERRFAPLLNGSFRSSAREFMALAALKRGDFEQAGKLLDQIVVDANAPANLRQRAQGFLSLVRGGGKFTPGPAAPLAPVAPPAK
jgi:hypothetical protein